MFARRVLVAAGADGKGVMLVLRCAIVAVGQVQKPLLDERVGLGRDIPNFPGALLCKNPRSWQAAFFVNLIQYHFQYRFFPASMF